MPKYVGRKLCIDSVYFWCMKSWLVKLNLISLTIHAILRRYQHISFGLYKTQLCNDVPCFRTSIKMFNNVCRLGTTRLKELFLHLFSGTENIVNQNFWTRNWNINFQNRNAQERQCNWHIILTTVSTPLFATAVFPLFAICGQQPKRKMTQVS